MPADRSDATCTVAGVRKPSMMEPAGNCRRWGPGRALEGCQARAWVRATDAGGGGGRKMGLWCGWGGEREHAVSTLTGRIRRVGGWWGVGPRLKVSMMFMRPPQHGHGWVA